MSISLAGGYVSFARRSVVTYAWTAGMGSRGSRTAVRAATIKQSTPLRSKDLIAPYSLPTSKSER